MSPFITSTTYGFAFLHHAASLVVDTETLKGAIHIEDRDGGNGVKTGLTFPDQAAVDTFIDYLEEINKYVT